ncbi:MULTISPECIES: integrase core domain-containing protein [Kocuria]|jgi:hypothetical protein|uniref:Integrase catalytic domain-containing protein n=3 Tax=Kocuria TaxID=57493 RepID=A0A2N4T100_9MICC|nr:hypothetical protein BJF77_18735 [Kocuria sp. CNJ-770]PLC11904.1 hypothetical protein AUQ48_06215 [Kocuria flava]
MSPHRWAKWWCPNDYYSEAAFKTLKYRPDFPDAFGSLEDARAFCAAFYRWYNTEHRHSGIGMHTPYDVHHGRAGAVRAARPVSLSQAYAATPERFDRKHTEPPEPARDRLDQPTRTEHSNPTDEMNQKVGRFRGEWPPKETRGW